MWVVNMIVCIGIAFGSFIWAIWRTLKAEGKKNTAKSSV